MQGETAENLDKFIGEEEEQRRFDEHMIKVLQQVEKEIANGQCRDAHIAFADFRKKYQI